MNTRKTCELCGSEAKLRQSHVVPHFVSKWFKETSLGHLRMVNKPNQRVQAGPKEEWLCNTCEQRFSDWEKPFSEQVFQYIHSATGQQKAVYYGNWALKFATSISWRTLHYYRNKGIPHFSKDDMHAANRADAVWRDFLLNRRQNPGEFEQHVLVVDALAKSSAPVSPFLNRYLLRTIQSDLITSKSLCITYTKLCKVIIIGFIRVSSPQKWKGTKLHVNHGVIGGDCEISDTLLSYWNDKADQAAAALAAMSESQKSKVDQVFTNNTPNELAESEVFRAMCADVDFSGDRAFAVTGRSRKKQGDAI